MTGIVPISAPTALKCEALVIGTGAGGASCAAALAEAGVDVLMLDEGPYIPLDVAPQTLSQALPTIWRCGGLTATVGRTPIAFAEGCCIGGSTEINSGIFQRAPGEIIEGWAQAHHLPDFSIETLSPFYDRAAAAVNASLTPGPNGPPTEILRQAGEVMGWSTIALQRARRESPSPRYRLSGFATGAKQSMGATLIPRALSHNASLVAKCRVERLVMRNGRVTCAIAIARDAMGRCHRIVIHASQFFLCAGATQSPALLQRSGFHRNIGCSFQLHPTIRVFAAFRDVVNAHRNDLPLVAITEFMPALRFGGSVFTLSTFGLTLAEDWSVRSKYLSEYAHCAMYYAMIKPDGVGRVWTVPGLAEPVLTYRLTGRDWRRLRDGLLLLSRALLAAGAIRVVPSIQGHAGWTEAGRAEGDLENGLTPKRTALMTIHLFAGCQIGGDPDLFPLDPWGWVVGIENLMVADASMLPGAPGVNPQATIMALAFRAADRYLATRR